MTEKLKCTQLESKQHLTKPINRFTEASLVKELEKLGIGRPSTYNSFHLNGHCDHKLY